MKKFLISLLAVVYLGMSSGIAMELHYCMGRLAGIDWFSSNHDRCGRCGMKAKKGGCCSDEYKFVKLEDAHKQAGTDQLKAPLEANAVPLNHPELFIPFAALTPGTESIPDPPPPLPQSPQVMFCVFRL